MQQRPRQAQPLGHATREAGDQGIALVGQVHQLEHLLADLSPGGALDPVGRGEELEILNHFHIVIHTEEVRHVADHPADLFRTCVDRVAADRGLAPARVEQGRQDPHRRGLAGSIGTDEAVNITLLERQVEPVQSVEVAIHLGQVVGLDHRGAPWGQSC